MAGKTLAVLFIPSQERVFESWLADKHFDLDPRLGDFSRRQRELLARFEQIFTELGIPHSDALPFLLEAMESEHRAGRNLYPLMDVHPRKAGYEAYAKAAAELLSRIDDY